MANSYQGLMTKRESKKLKFKSGKNTSKFYLEIMKMIEDREAIKKANKKDCVFANTEILRKLLVDTLMEIIQ